ncbi:hypothetical protein CPB84DRAFT_1762498 [Gymnopilus junonius]|uniref:Uncharacterized protein n=1 Tax=Gymnopilus junonius TaxID=109634 RepID=A0A9P5TTY8_GYMJU|nr:hypothetical protein CPB84DRAFT_1762498 [Gymnopilus junonius]
MSYSPIAPLDPKGPEQGLGKAEVEPLSASTLPASSYAQEYGHHHGPAHRERRRVGRRVFHFLVAGTFVWLLLSFLAKGSFHGWIRHHRHRETWTQLGKMDGDYEYVIPGDVVIDECVQGGDWTPSEFSSAVEFPGQEADAYPFHYEAETSFDLPLSSDTLFFISRGRLHSGSVRVATSSDQAEDTATVNIIVRYNHDYLLDSTKACLLSRHEGEKGVGLFTPEWRRGRRFPGRDGQIRYELSVVLPELSVEALPLTIKNFETDIVNSAHFLEDLNGKVFFDSLLLKGSNGPVHAKSVNSTTVEVHASNAPIYGKFNTTSSLVLETSNGPIFVDVGLESDADGSSPTFKAHTSNGKIEAHTSLTSASGSGGSFEVTTSTSNAPLVVTFPASPVDSKLNLKGSTSNAQAAVFLHPAYEGSFDLHTSLARPSVNRNPEVEDPTGQGRKRVLEISNYGRPSTTGNVYWGAGERKSEGSVVVRTSISPVVLAL